MFYKKLHDTIEGLSTKRFGNEKIMLSSVLDALVEGPETNINGGRIWRLNLKEKAYELIYQTGNMGKIDDNFKLYLNDYPIFDNFYNKRTVLGDETNETLRMKGIFQYAATGVGSKLRIGNKYYFEYLLAVNCPNISREFAHMLSIIATVFTSKLKEWRSKSSEKNLKANLDAARELQRIILPQHEYSFHDYEMYGATIPAAIVGGDFFDYLDIGDNQEKLGIALGDAASKGVAAAAEAMYISGALRMAVTIELKISSIMKRLNRLVHLIFGDDKFTSMFYGELSSDMDSSFFYANAGHNPPMFLRAKENKIYFLNPTGPVFGPAPMLNYTIDSIKFEEDDILLIYSDGLEESTNEEGEHFDIQNIKKLFLSHKNKTAKEITLLILEEAIKFSANGTYNDDKTIVVIKKNKKKHRQITESE